MYYATALYTIVEGLRHVVLPDDLVKGSRSPLAIEGLGHSSFPTALLGVRRQSRLLPARRAVGPEARA